MAFSGIGNQVLLAENTLMQAAAHQYYSYYMYTGPATPAPAAAPTPMTRRTARP